MIDEVVRGAAGAWQQLFGTYAPIVDRIARRSRSMGSLAHSDDARRDVMARVFERLRRDEYRALRLYLGWQAHHPERTFDDWLTIVTTNVIRDYLAARLGPRSGTKQLLDAADELDESSLLVLPHVTTRETARELLDFARRALSDDQAACLVAWLEGHDFDAIAVRAKLHDRAAAERGVRAALAKLRRLVNAS